MAKWTKNSHSTTNKSGGSLSTIPERQTVNVGTASRILNHGPRWSGQLQISDI